MDRKHRGRGPVIGASSLLVIFAVLCLTVFALLTLSTVRAGERLSEASAQAVVAYYEADRQAEEVFARLRAGERPAGVKEEGGVYAYTCPVSDTQRLCVELLRTQEGWTVLRWQTESAVEWESDESLNIWDGFEPR